MLENRSLQRVGGKMEPATSLGRLRLDWPGNRRRDKTKKDAKFTASGTLGEPKLGPKIKKRRKKYMRKSMPKKHQEIMPEWAENKIKIIRTWIQNLMFFPKARLSET